MRNKYCEVNETMSEQDNTSAGSARLATITELRPMVAAHLAPVPCDQTLRAWFDDHHVPRFKANPRARRGGGPVYYSVPAVEKLLRHRLLPGRLAPVEEVAA
jgi:hypothetical protein